MNPYVVDEGIKSGMRNEKSGERKAESGNAGHWSWRGSQAGGPRPSSVSQRTEIGTSSGRSSLVEVARDANYVLPKVSDSRRRSAPISCVLDSCENA